MNQPTCPLGHQCHTCMWQVTLRGKDPQSNQEIDRKDCAIAVLPILLVENAQRTNHVAAGIESFRNEMVKSNEAVGANFAQALLGPRIRNLEKLAGPEELYP